MSLEIYKFNELDEDQQVIVAQHVSAFTNARMGEDPQMLRVSEQDILNKYAGNVAFVSEVFSGYIGASTPIEHNGSLMSEVGNLMVPQEFRKRGVAHKLVEVMTGQLVNVNKLPYAFCNPLSSPIFESEGYFKVTSEAIPPIAFCLCSSCRKRPESGCCDSMLIYTGDIR